MSDNSKESQGGSGNDKLLLDHDYDGIQELDHVLPRWWLGILYASMIFAAWYVGYYMSGLGPTPQEELAIALKQIEASKPAPAANAEANNEMLLAAFKDPEKLKHGKEVFLGKCLACHGDKGQGIVGPNLTDDFWIHGKGTLKDISAVITTGVAEKGMPPWGPVLSGDDIRDVAAFIHSLHGSNPENAKTPQGEKQEYND